MIAAGKESKLKNNKTETDEIYINNKKLNKACIRALAMLTKSCERLKQ